MINLDIYKLKVGDYSKETLIEFIEVLQRENEMLRAENRKYLNSGGLADE